MSQVLIQQYLNQLQDLRKVSGTRHEMVVFPARRFHQDNNVARELYKLEATFFQGRHRVSNAQGDGALLRRHPRKSPTHHEKQTFLKVIYENFYKV